MKTGKENQREKQEGGVIKNGASFWSETPSFSLTPRFSEVLECA
jgi:hypothetical protein